jgi:hypothetical protein
MDYYVASKIKEKAPSTIEQFTDFITGIPLTFQKYWPFLLFGIITAIAICVVTTIFLKKQRRDSEAMPDVDQNNKIDL